MSLTVQDIFDTVMVLDNERALEAAGDEVARGLVVVDTVTKWLEAEAARVEGLLTTDDLLYTDVNVEYTDWPAELVRLDALWRIDPDTNRPIHKIDKIQGIGNHIPGYQWPFSELAIIGSSSNVVGPPREYAASGPGGKFYWAPLPGDEYWIRAYGLWAVPDDFYTDAASPFPYPSTLRLPFAGMCAQLFKTGLDRDLTGIQDLAFKTFRGALKGLSKFDQSEPLSRVYSEVHSE